MFIVKEYSLPVLKEEHLGSGVTTLNMLHSEDHTLMFKEYKFYDDPKAFHTSVVQLKDGKTVLAYTAVKEVGHLRLSTSHDGGR